MSVPPSRSATGSRWTDEAGSAVAGRRTGDQSAELASHQWDAIARPDYADSTKRFKGDEALSALPLALPTTWLASALSGGRRLEFPQQEHLCIAIRLSTSSRPGGQETAPEV